MLLKWLTTLKTLVVKTNNMCSKFSSSFLSKSPILAGEYGSGVDGMRYFSPKQPVSKNPTKPKDTKKKGETPEKERPERKKLETLPTIITPEGMVPVEPEFNIELPTLNNVKEKRIIQNTTQKPVERQATTPAEKAKYKQYLADVESGKIERNTTYDEQTTFQNQQRTGNTINGKLNAGGMSEWENVGDSYE